MECTEFQAIVAGEREEDLSTTDSLGFESHLDSCASCREAVSRAEEDLERLGQIADPPLVSSSAWMRVDEAVRAEAKKKPGREDPFGPLVDERAPVAPALVPAMPVTLAPARGAAAVVGGAAPRGKPLLAFVACAAAAVIMVVFALARPVERPHASHGSNTDVVIGPVKPPEAGDVRVLDDETKLGPGFKKLKGTKFIKLGE